MRERVITKRNIVTFECRRYKKLIHETLVGSREKPPKSLESTTKHNELDVVLESSERVYEREQRGKACRHLQRRSGHRRVQVLSCVHQRIILRLHSRPLDAVVEQRKERESNRSQLEKRAHDLMVKAV